MKRALFLSTVLFGSVIACGGSDAPAPPPATPAAAAPAAATPAALVASSSKPDSDKATWKDDPSAKSCHTKASGSDLVAGVNAMASACVTGMQPLGAPTTGESTGSGDTMVKTIPLAAKSGHCYRVLGLAEPTVKDFDVAIMDSNGKSAGEDGTDSNDAVVREKGVICFTQDDNVNVNAAVANGKGKWAVGIWGN